MNELSPAGTAVLPATSAGASGSPILGYSKDSWAVLTYSWAAEAPGCAGCFAIDPSTAAVTLGTNGGALNFNTAQVRPTRRGGSVPISHTLAAPPPPQAYNLTVRVYYAAVLMSDTAPVTIWIREVNKPSVYQGLFNASTGAPMTSIVISEATPPGTAIGRLSFTDPNTAYPWNARLLAVVQSFYGAGLFAVNSTSGVISVAAPLAYWDAPSFAASFSCTDADPFTPLTTIAAVTITLVQVNTVQLAGLDVPATTGPASGVNASAGAVAFQTSGGTVVEIVGSGFGPTARYMAANSAPAAIVTAAYGPPGLPGLYTATGCAVFTPNTVIRCTTTAGVGAGHVWTVLVAGAWSATSALPAASSSYFAPAITSVRKWDAGRNAYALTNLLVTEGFELVAVDGTNLSPAAADTPVWQYWAAAAPATVYTGTCYVGLAYARLLCSSAPGVGVAFYFQVRVGGERRVCQERRGNVEWHCASPGPLDSHFLMLPLAPCLPVCRFAWAASGRRPSTPLPSPTRLPRSPLSPSSRPSRRWRGSWTRAAATGSSSTARVSGAAGDGETGPASRRGSTTPLSPPIADLGPAGTPSASLVAQYSAALGSPTALTFTATSCYVPATASSVAVICTTAAGAGTGLQVSLGVGGQTAVSLGGSIAYRPPVMVSLSGRGFTNAETVGGQPCVKEGERGEGREWEGRRSSGGEGCQQRCRCPLTPPSSPPPPAASSSWATSSGRSLSSAVPTARSPTSPPHTASRATQSSATPPPPAPSRPRRLSSRALRPRASAWVTSGRWQWVGSSRHACPASRAPTRRPSRPFTRGPAPITPTRLAARLSSSTVSVCVGGGDGGGVFYVCRSEVAPPPLACYCPSPAAAAGDNFGPAGTPIDLATYGPNGTGIVSPGCTLVIPHTEVRRPRACLPARWRGGGGGGSRRLCTPSPPLPPLPAQVWCNTSVGAGAALSWILTIGGQRSVAPSTAYGPPQITALGGAVADAPTQGGASVTLYGSFLSVQVGGG